MESNNQTPLQPQVDTSYLKPPVLQPQIQQMNIDIKRQALPYANKGGAPSAIPDDFGAINNLNADKRLKAVDYSTPISDVYARLPYSGELVSRYENFMPGIDNNERLAAQQTTGEKWANGATKFLAKTGSAVVGGTAGLVYGVGAALKDGSFSSIYDNSFSNTLADWDTKLSYQLPNLYTKQEQEKGLGDQVGTANFWADKFLGGISFTAGAIISEGIWAYATGGMSLASSGARLGTKLARAGRWGVEALGEAGALKGISKYKGFYKTMLEGTIEAGKISKSLPNALGKAGELASSVGVLARSAGYEASVEALQYKREAEENFHQNFLSANGREPSPEELADFKTHNESAANAVFGVNMAILMPSNLVTMGHILDIKSPIKTGFTNFINKKAFGYGIEKTVGEMGKATYKTLEATTGQKIARNVFNYAVKPSLAEGLFEEGLQGVTTKVANRWVEHSYDPKHSNSNLDMMGAFYESMGEQYGTKEGWVENGLGMIIGIVGGSVNARSENKAKADELSYQAAVATTFQTDNLQGMLMPNRLQSANRMAGFSEDARVEAQKGNVSKSALAQKSALLTYINAKMIMGDDISDIVSEVKMGLDSTTEDQWKEAGIAPDQIDDYKQESLKDFEDLAKDWKSNKTYWGYMIGQKIVGEQNLDTQIAGDVFGTMNSKTGAVIEALAWQSTIGETANKHMKDAQDAIARELGVEHANALGLNSKLRAESRDLKSQINVATRSYKTELARRDALVKRIEKLNAAPKSPEGANKPAGKQAGAMTQALLESEEKITALDNELQGYAEQINRTSNYQKDLGAIDFSSQDLSTDAISGQDLVSLQDNLAKFQTVLDGMHTTNPQRASYLNEMLKEYSDSEGIFLQNQATQRAILHPDFKIEQINSWVKGKVKKNAPMNENTQEWLQDVLETYQKGKVASMSLQAEASTADDVEAKRQEIVAKLDAIEDPQSEEAKALQAELDDLDKTEEEQAQVEVPEDKGEVQAKTEEQKIRDEIANLEAKRQEELSNIPAEPTADIQGTYNPVIEEKPNGFHITVNGKTIGIFDTKEQAEKELADKIKTLQDSIITEPIVIGDGISIEGINVDGNTFSVLNISQRMVTIVDINGVKVPFYLTTGLGGKNLTAGWYPMFGYSKSGWLNKTNGADMENYYNGILGDSAAGKLKEAAEGLNNHFGTEPNSVKQTGLVSTEKTQDTVNNILGFETAENPKLDPTADLATELAKLDANIKSIGTAIDNATPIQKQAKVKEDKAAKINQKYDSKIETLKNELNGKKPSQVEVYKKRIAEALKGRHNYLTYMGDNYDDVANKKPTSAEVEEFKKLRDEKKFNDERYKELQQKLSDWKLLDSAVDEQYVSIGDLILGVEQMEEEAAKEDTVDEIKPEHAPDIADSEGMTAGDNTTRYDILQNTNGSMTVKKRTDGKFTLHHLKLSTVASRMNTEDFTIKNKDGKEILFGEEEPGTVLTVEGTEFKVIGGNAIEVKADDFMKLQDRLNMYPLNTGTTNWTYSDIYTKVGEDFVKMQSDFKDNTINAERIYELQDGDKLSITINNDEYNEKLFAEYESAKGDKAKKAALKKLKDNLKLNATTTNGVKENVSILKALREEINEHFIRLRERAFELYMAAEDKTNIKLGIDVLVDGIFLGSPRFTIGADGTIQNTPITERGAKEIVATGYIENGNVVTSREVKDVNKTFVGKLSKKNANKKIPIIVFRRGNYNVAYPVTMNKTGNDLGGLFDSILDMKISSQEKVRKWNQEIQNNKIKAEKLAYEDIYDQVKLDKTRKAFAEVTTFLSAEDFADKNYKLDNIVNDASANIDLENLDNIIADAKLRIKLDDSIKYTTTRDLKLSQLTDVETNINALAIELYRDLLKNAHTKYVNSDGKILEDTHYIQTFDNYKRSVIHEFGAADSPSIIQWENESVLREAFKNLDPRIKKIIGSETVSKVNYLFRLKDSIKKQITPNASDVNNGANNSSC